MSNVEKQAYEAGVAGKRPPLWIPQNTGSVLYVHYQRGLKARRKMELKK